MQNPSILNGINTFILLFQHLSITVIKSLKIFPTAFVWGCHKFDDSAVDDFDTLSNDSSELEVHKDDFSMGPGADALSQVLPAPLVFTNLSGSNAPNYHKTTHPHNTN